MRPGRRLGQVSATHDEKDQAAGQRQRPRGGLGDDGRANIEASARVGKGGGWGEQFAAVCATTQVDRDERKAADGIGGGNVVIGGVVEDIDNEIGRGLAPYPYGHRLKADSQWRRS